MKHVLPVSNSLSHVGLDIYDPRITVPQAFPVWPVVASGNSEAMKLKGHILNVMVA